MISQSPHNRYQVTSTLGRGAMGVVYRAIDRQTQHEVALKVIASDLAPEADLLARFRREGEALQTLRHRNIVAFVDMYTVQGHQVIVMEYVPGGNLHHLIREGPLPLARAREITLDLCDALTSAHRLNIIHRDIKPENVLLAEDGTPKLTDFGLARLVGKETRLTGSGILMGTPDYMSPEAWEGHPLDAQGDIWSLGVMLYEMLTGELPFRGDTIASLMHKVLTAPAPDVRTVRPEVPPALAEVVGRMLRRDVGERYRTMRQVAVDLEAIELRASPAPGETHGEAEETGRITALLTRTEAPPASAPPAAEEIPEGLTPTPSQPAEDLNTQTQRPALDTGGAVTVTPPEEAGEGRRQAGLFANSAWLLGGAAALAVACLLVVGAFSWRAVAGMLLAPSATPTRPTLALVVVTAPAAVTPLPRQTSPPTVAASLTHTAQPTASRTPVPPTATPTLSPVLAPSPAVVVATPVSPPPIGASMVSDTDGMRLFYVPAGTFTMGSTSAEINQAKQACPSCDINILNREQPQHTVYLDAYWIDQTDVTNAMFAKFVHATGYRTDAETGHGLTGFYDPQAQQWKNAAGTDWQHPQGPGSSLQGLDNHPVVQVSYADAEAYCKWAGRQLPTEAQWEKAARGTDGRIYPWRNGSVDGNHLNFADKNVNITGADPRTDDGYQFTSPVGAYPKGASPYGALDMAGNVAQWVADLFGDNYYSNSPSKNPLGPTTPLDPTNPNGPTGLLRGGSWSRPAVFARTASRVTNVRHRVSGDLGFRCVGLP